MGDRYRYPRPPSPMLYNPARASLPLSMAYGSTHLEHHMHGMTTPTRREVIPISNPRSNNDRTNTAGPVVTTYKVKADPLTRGGSIREGSRSRRATLDTTIRPTSAIVTTSPTTYRPVIHGGRGNGRTSPVNSPYRSSGEDIYYSVPASSGKHRSRHDKRYSSTVDNADIHNLARKDTGRLSIGGGREGQAYIATRPRTIYPASIARHPDITDEYGGDSYEYTNPRELVQYDLNNSVQPRHSHRQSTYESGRSRAGTVAGYADVSRSYDPRERGPPPSTRGFDRIPVRTWPNDPQAARMAVPPPQPIDLVQRPARGEPSFLELEPQIHRRNSSRRRPVSVYQERDIRRHSRDEYYDARNDDVREKRDTRHRHEASDGLEQRYALRAERPERLDRDDRVERKEHSEREDRRSPDHKTKLTAGLSTAAAALGMGAIAKNIREDDIDNREDREDGRRYREDSTAHRRRDRDPRDERDLVDHTGRDLKERPSHRDDRDSPPLYGRDIKEKPGHRDDRDSPPLNDRSVKDTRPRGDNGLHDLAGRDLKERQGSRDEREPRDGELDQRERRKHRNDASGAGTDSSVSDETLPSGSHKERRKRESGAATPFNPRNPMDLKALRQELASQDSPAVKEPPLAKEPDPAVSKDSREAITEPVRDDRSRRDLVVNTERQLRVVSPPREKVEDKPVKGILRQPREKFPEDPSPIREGVAPLKDAKKDGVPPDARWTKIPRKLVNPAALEVGKERYEARDDFVIVLRVLSKNEVQAYATATQQIRAAREMEEREASEKRRRARREQHERHKRERAAAERGESSRHESRRHHRHGEGGSNSESYETTDEEAKPKMLESPPKKESRGQTLMSGGLGGDPSVPASSAAR